MSDPLETLQGTPQSAALRALIWKERRAWSAEVLAHPSAVSGEARTYAAGGATALESVYNTLAKVLDWRKAGSDQGGPPPSAG